MARRMQRWSPDTCKCGVYEEWDDMDPDPDPPKFYLTHTAAQTLADQILDAQRKPRREQPAEILCPAHMALGRTPAMFAALHDENDRKNITIDLAVAVVPQIADSTYVWAFDKDRVLEVSFPTVKPPLTKAELATIQDSCDLQFGPLRVRVRAVSSRTVV